MTSLKNLSELKQIRKTLRKNQTLPEKLLWGHLRKRQFYGLRFFRQYSVGSYVLDFYCPEKRLALEVDGSQHGEDSAREYDQKRTAFLQQQGITVLRVWNNDVTKNMEGIFELLHQKTFLSHSKPLPTSPFAKGRSKKQTI